MNLRIEAPVEWLRQIDARYLTADSRRQRLDLNSLVVHFLVLRGRHSGWLQHLESEWLLNLKLRRPLHLERRPRPFVVEDGHGIPRSLRQVAADHARGHRAINHHRLS